MFRSFARLAVLILAGITAFNPAGVVAQTADDYGDEVYKPSMGQAGKDVIWIPTPDALVTAMLRPPRSPRTTSSTTSAQATAGFRSPRRSSSARERSASNTTPTWRSSRGATRGAPAWSDLVHIITGDIFKENFSDATVVTMYLLPDLNLKLRPILLKMKPGTRIASHAFNMGDWEPDQHLSVEARDGYLWYVPASVEGTWAFKEDGWGSEGTVTFVQRYQRVGGTVTTGGKTQPLLGPALRGDKLSFGYNDSEDSCALRMSSSTGVPSRACLAGARPAASRSPARAADPAAQ